MTSRLPRPLVLALLLGLAGLTLFYADAIRTPFLNDDYLFLEEARTRPLAESLVHLGALGNYYRPLSRQLYFEALAPVAGGNALVFHLVNYALFLSALALLADLLLAFLPLAGVAAGVACFALLPFQRVNLTWVSCSQDLLALVGVLLALALHRRGRRGWALVAAAAAFTSKESALPLPLAIAAWEVAIERLPTRVALRRAAPYALLALAWAAVALGIRARFATTEPLLSFDLTHFAAGYAHLIQSLLGLEHPPGMIDALLRHAPAIVPLVLLGAAGLGLTGRRPPEPGDARGARPRALDGADPRPARFAILWLLGFGFVTGPAASGWSAYYYTLAAVGASILVGLLLRRIDRWGWVAFTAFLLWWHAGSTETRAISVEFQPWTWTSHLTTGYFERAAALTDTLSRRLREIEPHPPRGSRLFFVLLPPSAGFQMGNGALVRHLYGDTTLASYFYSQFSESTAADRPVRFFWWDGRTFSGLYRNARDPFFQVGSDLLLLDHPQGAEHAFLRGLREGGDRMDHLYWLGWTELMLGRRDRAEAAWLHFGARDDSLYWMAHLRAARNALRLDQDTLEARRHLVKAIEFGIGRPEAHAVLGKLLAGHEPKYAMLELKAATFLRPDDWLARRDLLELLVQARLDDAARRELEALKRTYPTWRADSVVTRIGRALEARSTRGDPVVRF